MGKCTNEENKDKAAGIGDALRDACAQTVEEEHLSSKGRMKQECLVPYCKKKVVHIPRHLAKVHKRSVSKSRAAVTNFYLRKKYTFKSKESAKAGNRKRKHNEDSTAKAYKDYHKRRICPMIGCAACVKRLPAHLKNVHGINPSSGEYRSLLNKALPKKKRPYCRVLLVHKLEEV